MMIRSQGGNVRVIVVASFALFTLSIVATEASAQTFSDPGSSGVAGLLIEPGAAETGTAGAFGAVASDVFALYYNPAGTVHAGTYSVGLMHNVWINDIRSEYLGFVYRPDKVAIGLSVLYNSIGDIERRSETPTEEPLSLFDAQDLVAGLTAGAVLSPDLSLGVTAKMIYEKIDVYSGSAYAIDLGGYYTFVPGVVFGFSVANLGSKMKLRNQEDDLPTLVRGGGTYSYRTFKFGASLVTPTDDKTHLHVGVDDVISDILTVRAGYASGYDVRNFAFGFGIKHKFASIDYSYTPIKSDLGDSHRFSLTLSWR